jgi:hypothetical protein
MPPKITRHSFGEVAVYESKKDGKPEAIISVPSMVGDVIKAEGLMCNLIDAIAQAREIIKDPI